MEENIREYQINYFLSPILSEEEVSELSNKIKGFISEPGGEIKAADDPKIQKLSFIIRKHQQGYFSKIIFLATPDKISDIEKKVRLEKEVLRFLIEIVYPVKERKEKAKKKPKPAQQKEDGFETEEKMEEKPEEEKETKKKKVKLEEIDQKLEEIIGDI